VHLRNSFSLRDSTRFGDWKGTEWKGIEQKGRNRKEEKGKEGGIECNANGKESERNVMRTECKSQYFMHILCISIYTL